MLHKQGDNDVPEAASCCNLPTINIQVSLRHLHGDIQFTALSSTSKTNVLFGGMAGGEPLLP